MDAKLKRGLQVAVSTIKKAVKVIELTTIFSENQRLAKINVKIEKIKPLIDEIEKIVNE